MRHTCFTSKQRAFVDSVVLFSAVVSISIVFGDTNVGTYADYFVTGPARAFQCNKDGFFRDPYNCTRFYRCADVTGSQTHFQLFQFDCPPGTVYNEETNICNHPAEVPICSNWFITGEVLEGGEWVLESVSEDEPKGEPVPGSELLPVPFEINGGSGGALPGPISPSVPSEVASLICERSGLSRSPYDCRRFQICVDIFGNGTMYQLCEYPCPLGTVFSNALALCTDPEKAEPCNDIVTTVRPGPVGPSSTTPQPTAPWPPSPPESFRCMQSGYFRHPTDCSRYYQCVNLTNDGRVYQRFEFMCGHGAVFDESISVCNHPSAVPGCSGAVPTTSTPRTTTEERIITPSPRPQTAPPSSVSTTGTVTPPTGSEISRTSTAVLPVVTGRPPVAPSFECLASGIFPHPTNCSRFFRCANITEANDRFVRYEFSCGRGTVFDPVISNCNHPGAVHGCGDGVKPPVGSSSTSRPVTRPLSTAATIRPWTTAWTVLPVTSRPPWTVSPVTSRPPWTVFPVTSRPPVTRPPLTFRPPVTSGPVTPPTGSEIGHTSTAAIPVPTGRPPVWPPPPVIAGPECKMSGLIPHPTNCSRFYRCANITEANDRFIRYEFSCGIGTVFDPTISNCNHPGAVPGCSGHVVVRPPPGVSTVRPVTWIPSNTSPSTASTTPPVTLPQVTPPTGSHIGETTTVVLPVSTVSPTGTPWPRPVIAGPECKISGLIPHPTNCSRFYQCANLTVANDRFLRYEFSCGVGTVFDPVIGVCNHPAAVPGCAGYTVPVTATVTPITWPSPTVPSTTPSTRPEIGGTSTTMLPVPTVQPTGTTWPPPVIAGPECKISGLVPHPNNCSRFYHCANITTANDRFIRYEFSCGAGTVFDSSIGVCNHPSMVPRCAHVIPHPGTTSRPVQPPVTPPTGAIISETTTVIVPVTSVQPPVWPPGVTFPSPVIAGQECRMAGIFPHPTNCSRFYRCANITVANDRFIRYEFSCGPGTVFDPNHGVCNHPGAVPSCRGGTPVPEPPVTIIVRPITSAPSPFMTSSTSEPATLPTGSEIGGSSTIVLPVSTVQPPIQPTGTPWPPPVIAGTECKISGLIPHPTNCSRFYQCSNLTMANDRFIRYEFSCGTGTVFDPIISVCNHPSAVPRCAGYTPPTGPETGGTSTAGLTVSTVQPPISPTGATSPPPVIAGPECKLSGLIPHPTNCSKYYHCANLTVANDRFLRYEFSCGIGTVFDPSVGVCNHPSAVPRCAGFTVRPQPSVTPTVSTVTWTPITLPVSTLTPPVQPTGTPWPRPVIAGPECKITGFVPHPTNCSRFYQCVNITVANDRFIRYEFSCGIGTVFDPVIGVCNHLAAVPRCAGVTVQPGPPVTGTNSPQPPVTTTFIPPRPSVTVTGRPVPTVPLTVSTSTSSSTITTTEPPIGPEIGGTSTITIPASIITPPVPPTVTPWPRPVIAGPECKISGMVPHPTNCSRFYQCVNITVANDRFIRYEFSCGIGTVFDPVIGVCNHPAAVPRCAGFTVHPGTPVTTTFSPPRPSVTVTGRPVPTVPLTVSTSTSSSTITTTEPPIGPEIGGTSTITIPASIITPPVPPTVTPWPRPVIAGPECKMSGMIPHPTNCSRFYQCVNITVANDRFLRYEFSCGIGTVFDPVISVCNHPAAVPRCAGFTVHPGTPVTTTFSPPRPSVTVTGRPVPTVPLTVSTSTSSSTITTTEPPIGPEIGGTSTITIPASIITPPVPPTVTPWPRPVIAGPECKMSGMIPHPTNCSRFYQCVNITVANDRFLRYEFSCGIGTVFDPVISVCNHLAAVPRCAGFTVHPGTPVTTTFSPPRPSVTVTGRPVPTVPLTVSTSTSSSIITTTEPPIGPEIGGTSTITIPASIITPPVPPTVTPWPRPVIAGPECKMSGMIPHPTNCSRFYQCVNITVANDRFLRYEFSCGIGTVFDPVISVCNHPAAVPRCAGFTVHPGTPVTTTFSPPRPSVTVTGRPVPTVPLTVSTSTSSSIITTTEPPIEPEIGGTSTITIPASIITPPVPPTVTPWPRPVIAGPECKMSGMIPHPTNCSRFYQCVNITVANDRFLRYEFSCGIGTVFDPVISVCNHPAAVPRCAGFTVHPGTPVTTTFSPPRPSVTVTGRPVPTVPLTVSTSTSSSIITTTEPPIGPEIGGTSTITIPASIITPPVPPTVTPWPRPVIAGPECKMSGMIPHPTNCSRFYQCVNITVANDRFLRYEFSCGIGTVFDPVISVCNHPAAVPRCAGFTVHPGTPVTTTFSPPRPSVTVTGRPVPTVPLTVSTSTSSSIITTTEPPIGPEIGGTSTITIPASIITPPVPPTVTPWPRPVIAGPECKMSGMIPHPTNCSRFYQCVNITVANDRFLRYEFSCGIGTVFDPVISVCNHPAAVPRCAGFTVHPGTPVTTTFSPPRPSVTVTGRPVPTVPLTVSTSTSSSIITTTEPPIEPEIGGTSTITIPASIITPPVPPTVTPWPRPVIAGPECKMSGMIPHPTNCSRFYQCVNITVANDRFLRYEFSCGIGTVFDPVISVCNHPAAVPRCAGFTVHPGTPVTTTFSPPRPSVTVTGRPVPTVPLTVSTSTSSSIITTTEPPIGPEIGGTSTITIPASIITPPVPPTVTPWPRPVIAGPECKMSGMIPHPTNCSRFYQCVNITVANDRFLRYEFSCGIGTVFDPVISVCNHPAAVPRCAGFTVHPGTPVTTTFSPPRPSITVTGRPVPTVPLTVSTSTSSSTITTTEPPIGPEIGGTSTITIPASIITPPVPPTVTPWPRPVIAGPECKMSGMIPHPTNCSRFYQCVNITVANDRFLRYEFSCGIGTVFDPVISVCNHPAAVPRCAGFTVHPGTPVTTTFSPPRPSVTVTGRPVPTVPLTVSTSTSSSTITTTEPPIGPEIGGTSTITIPASIITPPVPLTVTPWPRPVIAGPECKMSGMIPHPTNCSRFYQCVNITVANDRFLRYEFSCGIGTVFDPVISVCNHPAAVPRCAGFTVHPGTPVTTTFSPPRPSVTVTGRPVPTVPITSSTSTSSSTATTEPPIGPEIGGTSTFVLPVSTVTPPVRPTGTPWPRPVIAGPECKISGMVPHPTNCSRFYQCVNITVTNDRFIRYEFSCGIGTVFDPVIGVCNHLAAVPRCAGVTVWPRPPVTVTGRPVPSVSITMPTTTISTTTEPTTPPIGPEIGGTSIIVIPVSTTTPPVQPTGTPWPPPVIAGPECKISGTIPHPSNCSRFYQCSNLTAANDRFFRYEFSCGIGTVFDPAIGVCNHPSAVPRCAGYIPPTGPETGEGASTTGIPLSTVQPPVPPTGTPYPPPVIAGSECKTSGLIPHPTNCSKFYHCANLTAANDRFLLYEFSCGIGTVFDPTIGVCNHPSAVSGCAGFTPQPQPPVTPFITYPSSIRPPSTIPPVGPEIGGTSTIVLPISTLAPPVEPTGTPWPRPVIAGPECKISGMVPHPNNCSRFYQCVNITAYNDRFIRYEFSCGIGTVFDPAISVCNHPSAVPGCAGYTVQPQPSVTSTRRPITLTLPWTTIQPISGPATPPTGPVIGATTSIVLPVSTVQPPIRPTGAPWPRPVIAGPECKISGLIPHPTNCSRFYQCVNLTETNDRFIRYEYSCGIGTVFDPAIRVCNHPAAVPGCARVTLPPQPPVTGTGRPVTSPSSTVAPTTGPGTPPTGSEIGGTSTITLPLTTSRPPLPPTGTTWPPPVIAGPECKISGLIPHPTNCSRFYQCSNLTVANDRFLRYEFSCGIGTVFDPTIGVCNHPSAVPHCIGYTFPPRPEVSGTSSTALPVSTAQPPIQPTGTTWPPPVIAGPECKVSGLIRHPTNCSRFYLCSNLTVANDRFLRYEFSCGIGTVFDPSISVCNHPQAVPGCAGFTVQPQTPVTPTRTPITLPTITYPSSTRPTTGPTLPPIGPEIGGTSTIVLPVSTVAPPVQPTGTPWPRPVIAGPECKISGMVPHPTNCSRFYQCVNITVTNDRFIRYEFSCGIGTVFDPKIGVCNHPGAVPGCSGSVVGPPRPTLPPGGSSTTSSGGPTWSATPPTRPITVPSGSSSTTLWPVTPPSGLITAPPEGGLVTSGPVTPPTGSEVGGSTTIVITVPIVSPAETTISPPVIAGPECRMSGNFRHPTNCSRFIRCVNITVTNDRFVRYDFSCGIGTVFDPAIGVCNHPSSVPGCEGHTVTAVSSTLSPSPGGTTNRPPTFTIPPPVIAGSECSRVGFFRVLHNCSRFYRCVNLTEAHDRFLRYDFTCGIGSVFDPIMEVCNLPSAVPGCEGTTWPKPPITGGSTEAPPLVVLPSGVIAPPCTASGFYRNPANCSIFHRCVNMTEDHRTFQRFDFLCGNDTVFDPILNVCNHASEVPGCAGQPLVTTSPPTTTAELVTIVPSPPVGGGPPCSRDGFFRHPDDCGRFVRCVINNVTGAFQRHEFICGSGNAFDERIQVCAPPTTVPGCEAYVAPSTTRCPEATTSQSSVVTTATPPVGPTVTLPTALVVQITPTTEVVIIGPPPRPTGPEVPCYLEGYFRHPKNCSQFYRCVDLTGNATRFQRVLFDCPFGTVFDELIGACNFPHLAPPCDTIGPDPQPPPPAATTTIVPTLPTTTEGGPDRFVCSESGKFQHSTDCSKFYLCQDLFGNNRNFHVCEVSCPEGTYFDNFHGYCSERVSPTDCHQVSADFPVFASFLDNLPSHYAALLKSMLNDGPLAV